MASASVAVAASVPVPALTSVLVPDFYGYNKVRTVSNISAHGTSQLNFCKKKTNLSIKMCSVLKTNVLVYSPILCGGLVMTHKSPFFSGSRLGSLIVFMTAFIEVMTYFQNDPASWPTICEAGSFLVLASIAANRVTLGRGKEINKVTRETNSAWLGKLQLKDKSPSLYKFEHPREILDADGKRVLPMEIFEFGRSRSKDLLLNVRKVYDTLGYTGPQSFSDLDKIKIDYDGLTQSDKDIIKSAGNEDFSGVHLSTCHYCKQNGENITAVFRTPFDLTDLLNYNSLCNGYVQYNTTNENREITEWITLNPTDERKTKAEKKINQAVAYIKLVIRKMNLALIYSKEQDEEDAKMQVTFFPGTNDKIEQINMFALHVLSAIVSHLILSLILEPDTDVYTPFLPITQADNSEKSIENIIKQIKHCKSYHYSNACREAPNANREDLIRLNTSECVSYDSSQEACEEKYKTNSEYQDTVTELKKFEPHSGNSNSNSNSSNSSNSNSNSSSNSMSDIEITPLSLVGDINELHLSQEEEEEIDELRKILEPTMNSSSATAMDESSATAMDEFTAELERFRAQNREKNKASNGDMQVDAVLGDKRSLENKETSNKSPRGIGGRKSKKQLKRKNTKISKKRQSSKRKNTIKKRKSSRRKK
jgi:hypothetical protein